MIQNRTEILFVKTCTYIHHHTKHLIQLYTMMRRARWSTMTQDFNESGQNVYIPEVVLCSFI